MSEKNEAKEKGLNKGLVVFTVLAIALMIGLVVTYAGSMSVLYLKADQVFTRLDASKAANYQDANNLVGKIFRMHGHLKPKTTRRLKGRLDYEFEIMDKASGKSLKVRYNGILPDTFRDNAELVLEGKLLTPKLYKAFSVFAKCPTKYKEEQAKGGKHPGKTPTNKTTAQLTPSK